MSGLGFSLFRWLAPVAASGVMVAAAAAGPGLRLADRIPVPGMTGTWDHITADGPGGLLFANAQDIDTLEIVDLRAGRVLRAVHGPFNRNQGVAWLADLEKLVVSNGRSGLCVFLGGAPLAPEKSVGIGLGADLMAYDPATRLLYVDHGGRDSNRGFGAVAVIDAEHEALVADIATDLRPAAMALDPAGPDLFVCLPGASEIAVIDRPARAIQRRLALGSAQKPVSIALDGADRRLFVATRLPARLIVLDAGSGRILASLPTAGDAEDVCYDAADRQIYASGLDGRVHVYHQADADHYELTAVIPTRPHAATAVWIPQLARYCLAVAPHGDQPASIWEYRPEP